MGPREVQPSRAGLLLPRRERVPTPPRGPRDTAGARAGAGAASPGKSRGPGPALTNNSPKGEADPKQPRLLLRRSSRLERLQKRPSGSPDLFSLIPVIFVMRSGWRNRLSERRGASREGQSRWDGSPASLRAERRLERGMKGWDANCRWIWSCSTVSLRRKGKVLGFPPPHQSQQRWGEPLLPQPPETSRLVLLSNKKQTADPRETLPPILPALREARREQGRARPPPSAPKLCISRLSRRFAQQLAAVPAGPGCGMRGRG